MEHSLMGNSELSMSFLQERHSLKIDFGDYLKMFLFLILENNYDLE